MSSEPNLTDDSRAVRLADLLDRAARVMGVGASPFAAEFYAGNRVKENEAEDLVAAIGKSCAVFAALDEPNRRILSCLAMSEDPLHRTMLNGALLIAASAVLEEMAIREGAPIDPVLVRDRPGEFLSTAPRPEEAARIAEDLEEKALP